ncbi:hypothetical protein VTJ04DRAFT_1846 [Mycothermus thermophilus]|uniref:uncharacterized protein n=1 Tax=Humicola insolens TaxID=85995 RepID=UPI0037424018
MGSLLGPGHERAICPPRQNARTRDTKGLSPLPSSSSELLDRSSQQATSLIRVYIKTLTSHLDTTLKSSTNHTTTALRHSPTCAYLQDFNGLGHTTTLPASHNCQNWLPQHRTPSQWFLLSARHSSLPAPGPRRAALFLPFPSGVRHSPIMSIATPRGSDDFYSFGVFCIGFTRKQPGLPVCTPPPALHGFLGSPASHHAERHQRSTRRTSQPARDCTANASSPDSPLRATQFIRGMLCGSTEASIQPPSFRCPGTALGSLPWPDVNTINPHLNHPLQMHLRASARAVGPFFASTSRRDISTAHSPLYYYHRGLRTF